MNVRQLAAKFRDAAQHPTPRIYSIDDAFECIKRNHNEDKLEPLTIFWEFMRFLANDEKVKDLISSFES